MPIVKVSSKNQIAAPAAVRRRLGIKAGDRLRIEVRGQRAIVEREAEAEASSVVDELLAIAPKCGGDWTVKRISTSSEMNGKPDHRRPTAGWTAILRPDEMVASLGERG